MYEEKALRQFVTVIFIITAIFIAYHVGRQSTITKVINIIEEEEQVSNETIILEDLKLDIFKLR